MEIGTKLQTARIEKAMTLRQISEVTKISQGVLELIERNEFSRLPGGVFTRGYLRAYAAQVGLDPVELLSEFRAQVESSLPAAPVKIDADPRFTTMRLLRVARVLALALAVAIYITFISRSAQSPSESEIQEVDAVPLAGEAESAGDVPVSITPPRAESDSEGLQVELQTRGECWISATADGRLVIYRLMHTGERATVSAREELLLRVGDAGALVYLINGAPGRQLGGPGEAVSVRITKDNADKLLASPRSPLDAEDAPTRRGGPHEIPAAFRQGAPTPSYSPTSR